MTFRLRLLASTSLLVLAGSRFSDRERLELAGAGLAQQAKALLAGAVLVQ